MLNRIDRSLKILQLTRKYFRAKQVPRDCTYNINGIIRIVEGEQALSMLLDIVSNDSYGLKRFNSLDNIVDIGANIGIFDLHASTLFPKAKILAFEPSIQSRLFLENNVAGLNIEVYPYAVGNSRGKVILNELDDLSASYISLENDISSLGSQECELISLNDIAAKLETPVSLLKLDCEGYEYEIMQASSFDSFRYIVGELHTCQIGNPKLGLEILKNRGFEIEQWFPFSDALAGVFWARNRNI
ncbi:FkbM family methyltransferase [Nostoc sp.]|uniref:FkbM family methyltransferase n=1 Tax=Nostoc sp. TaxID=1180 RepID=UPI002FF74DB6